MVSLSPTSQNLPCPSPLQTHGPPSLPKLDPWSLPVPLVNQANGLPPPRADGLLTPSTTPLRWSPLTPRPGRLRPSPREAERIMSGNCGVVAIWVTQPL